MDDEDEDNIFLFQTFKNQNYKIADNINNNEE